MSLRVKPQQKNDAVQSGRNVFGKALRLRSARRLFFLNVAEGQFLSRNEAVSHCKAGIALGPRKIVGAGERPPMTFTKGIEKNLYWSEIGCTFFELLRHEDAEKNKGKIPRLSGKRFLSNLSMTNTKYQEKCSLGMQCTHKNGCPHKL
jgi:hypothetical protein